MKLNIHVKNNKIELNLLGFIVTVAMILAGFIFQQETLYLIGGAVLSLFTLDVIATIVYLSHPSLVHKTVKGNMFFGVPFTELRPLDKECSRRVLNYIMLLPIMAAVAVVLVLVFKLPEQTLILPIIACMYWLLQSLPTPSSWLGEILMAQEDESHPSLIDKVASKQKYRYASLAVSVFFMVFILAWGNDKNMAVSIVFAIAFLFSAFMEVLLIRQNNSKIKNLQKIKDSLQPKNATEVNE